MCHNISEKLFICHRLLEKTSCVFDFSLNISLEKNTLYGAEWNKGIVFITIIDGVSICVTFLQDTNNHQVLYILVSLNMSCNCVKCVELIS